MYTRIHCANPAAARSPNKFLFAHHPLTAVSTTRLATFSTKNASCSSSYLRVNSREILKESTRREGS